jgi:indole-3-glycerol phosphate synthase
MILDEILKNKRIEINRRKEELSQRELFSMIKDKPKPRDFLTVLIKNKNQGISLIAEIKKASPSAGVIKKDLNFIDLAITYESAKASAISIVTDNKFFQGEISMLREVKDKVSLPILQKDFVIDEYQIYEGYYYGADAILIIVSYLDRERIEKFLNICKELKLQAVLEVHTESDLNKIAGLDTQIIGINNRNLYTFSVDLKTTLKLKILIPQGKVVISESGIKTREDVKLLQQKGIDAILVGEELIKSSDVRLKIKELLL